MDFKNINNLNNFLNFNSASEKLDNMIRPKLIEPGVKYFFGGVLKECNNYKQRNYTFIYNLSLLVLFCSILGIILMYRYKGNLSQQEINKKHLDNKNYIMSKLMYYNRADMENKQRVQNNMITNLPDYSNHPEASLLHKKIYF
tara:strand:- start:1605 stop:2033 length:429 start_codon:yes stop_codon:yes gene_type:complete